ncbi:MAG: hypothetical protein WBH07_07915 [Candidatus Methanoculleus thermohydrogenotrophicum]|jgi:hypothetical protein
MARKNPGRRATLLQGEVHGDARCPLQVLFEVHDVPPEVPVEVDQGPDYSPDPARLKHKEPKMPISRT